jgi:hypothetical protein
MALWLLALSALVLALAAFAYARHLARKLATLEEMYWALKFEHGELKAKVGDSPESKPNFIPLTQLKR